MAILELVVVVVLGLTLARLVGRAIGLTIRGVWHFFTGANLDSEGRRIPR
jgi:hypothetical protein